MWQEIILIIIAIFVTICVVYKLYRYFAKPYSPCDDCGGCSLKDQTKGKGGDCNVKINDENRH